MSRKIEVSSDALKQILDALNGPGHLIRELQVTRNLPGNENPINILMEDYENGLKRYEYVDKQKTCAHEWAPRGFCVKCGLDSLIYKLMESKNDKE